MRTRRHWLVLVLLWGGSWGTSSAMLPCATLPTLVNAPIEIVIELRAAAEVSRTLVAQFRGEDVLLPALEVLDLLEFRCEADSTGRLVTRSDTKRWRITIDPQENTASPLRTETIPALDTYWNGNELYVRAKLLARLLDVDCYVDISELSVTFDPIDELPLGVRLRRERSRRHLLASSEDITPERSYRGEHRTWRGATFDWALAMPDPRSPAKTAGTFSLGGNVMGGGLDVRYHQQFDDSTTRDLDFSWHGVWRSDPWVKQLQVGDTRSVSPRSRAIRGMVVTNSPFVRRRDFGETVVRGLADPGWEIELHYEGSLIGYTRVDDRGYYEFTVPVDYGQNTVEIRSFGPRGEVKIEERSLRVELDRLPDGAFEYAASGGTCPSGDCHTAFNLDLRYGFDPKWTLRGGTETFLRGPKPHLLHPYLALSGSPAHALHVQAEGILNALGALRLGLQPHPHFRAGIDVETYDTSVVEPVLTQDGRFNRTRLNFFLRPNPRVRSLLLHWSGSFEESLLGTTRRSSLGLTHRLHRVRIFTRWQEDFMPAGIGSWRSSALHAGLSTVLRTGARDWFRGIFVRADATFDVGETHRDRFRLVLGKRVAPLTRLEIGGGWSQEGHEPLFTIAVTSTTPAAFANSTVNRFETGETSSLVAGEGSLQWNRLSGQVEAYPFRSIGRGGLHGVVFVDTNVNGHYDAGEPTAANVRLQVGSDLVRTDAYGRYSLWNLPPFHEILISVDPESVENPLWVSDYELVAAEVLPNDYVQANIPLVQASEIWGSVSLMGHDPQPLGGVEVRLRSKASGRVFEARTFRDGEFYLLGLPPGEYDIELDPSYLERNRLVVATTPRYTVPVAATGRTPRALEIGLTHVVDSQ